MYAVGADKDHRLGWFHRRRGGGDQGIGSLQQIVVVPPADRSTWLSRGQPGSIGVAARRSIRPGRRMSRIRVAEPAFFTRSTGHRSQFQSRRWRRSARDPGAPAAASGAPEAPNRPADPLVLALRPRTGTPSLVHSLHRWPSRRPAGAAQDPAKITSGSYTVGQQCLERPNIVLGHRQVTGATAHQDARSGVINRCGQMAAKHDLRVDGERVGIAKLLEWADRRRTLV